MVKEAVCDSSTLILLARVGLLKELFHYADKVFISARVFEETVTAGKKARKEDAFIVERAVERGEIIVCEVKSRRAVTKVMDDFKMDLGEAESIALCIEKNALFLGTDDKQAVKACRAYGISFTTALAITVQLAVDGKIDAARAELAIEKLEQIGFYSEEIIAQARKEAGLNGKCG